MSDPHLLERLGAEVTVMIERTIQLWPWACVLVGIGVLLLLGPLSALAADERPAEGGARSELLQLERQLLIASSQGDERALESLLAEAFEQRTPGMASLGRKAFVERSMRESHLLLSLEGEELDARPLGNLGVITGWRRALVKLAEDDGLIDRQVFVHLAVRVGGRWALRSSYTAPDPG